MDGMLRDPNGSCTYTPIPLEIVVSSSASRRLGDAFNSILEIDQANMDSLVSNNDADSADDKLIYSRVVTTLNWTPETIEKFLKTDFPEGVDLKIR